MARSTGLLHPLASQPFIAYVLLVAACWTLVSARGYELPQAAHLRDALGLAWRVELSERTYLRLLAAMISALVAAWLVSVRTAACRGISLRGVTTGAIVLAAPLLLLPGLYSDDVYLYHFYGRELARYAVNPLLVPPSAFPDDPHLAWVYWRWLPSSYGPLWLSLSGGLSALAGDSLTAAVLLYRLAGLAAHLATVAVIWMAARPAGVTRASMAAVFFGWNPFVLFESVANAHNDALVATLACTAVLAWTRGSQCTAGMAVAAAAMVKPYAALLLVPLAAASWAHSPRGRCGMSVALVCVTAAATAGALYAPLWAGDALLRNIAANPASASYANSLWEWPARWFGTHVVDTLRFVLLVTALAVSARLAVRHDFASAALVAWSGFCFSLSWIWPWYFLPMVAVASLGGSRARMLVSAISLGGLLFYLAWPPPGAAHQWLYTWRSVMLFGPAIATLAWMVSGPTSQVGRASQAAAGVESTGA